MNNKKKIDFLKEELMTQKAKVNTVGKKNNSIVKLLFDETIPDNMEVDQSKFNTSMTAQIISGNIEIDYLIFGFFLSWEAINELVPNNFPDHGNRKFKDYSISCIKIDPEDDYDDSNYLLIGGHKDIESNSRRLPTSNEEFKTWVAHFGVPNVLYQNEIDAILNQI